MFCLSVHFVGDFRKPFSDVGDWDLYISDRSWQFLVVLSSPSVDQVHVPFLSSFGEILEKELGNLHSLDT